MNDNGTPTILRAAAVRDAMGTNLRPGVVVVQEGRVLLAASPDHPELRSFRGGRTVDLPRSLLLPVMVNAHAHLDLAGLGPQPYGGSFPGWLADVVKRRPATDAAIVAAVAAGAAGSIEAGVGFVGDIAGSAAAVAARLRAAPGGASAAGVVPWLPGVSYLECFGNGRRQMAGFIDLMERIATLPVAGGVDSVGTAVSFGIQPHAPYSAGLALYNAVGRYAQERDYRLSTHLAETREEVEFIRDGTGPMAELIRSMGKWDDLLQPTGMHPVEWLSPELRRGGWTLAHCNYVDIEQIRLLAYCRASVAYCPIASAYFGHHGHPYRTMIEAGVNVCLGTDSILCQPADEPQPLGIVPQMRYLYRRDRTDPATLLAMATTHGLRAMGLSESLTSFQRGAPARFIRIDIDPADAADPLIQAMLGSSPVTPLTFDPPAQGAMCPE